MDPERSSIWRIIVGAKSAADDVTRRRWAAELRRIHPQSDAQVRTWRVYLLRGRLDRASAEFLAVQLFCDGVLESHECIDKAEWPASDDAWVEVHLLPGVMDPVAISALEAASDLLFADQNHLSATIEEVRTARRYRFTGVDDPAAIEAFVRRELANVCIESYFISSRGRRDALPHGFPCAPDLPFRIRQVPLGGLSDAELAQLSRQHRLFLSAVEMRAIAERFAALGRDPTDLEIETLAQTWSEHCVHKTLKSAVTYRGAPFGANAASGPTVERRYQNLLADTIAAATRALDKPWCLSVFEDNAGVIEFDDQFGVAFKVETHNHPSAIEPYGGAATGVGGCIRDILGCGLGAKPVASTDTFCVAPPDFEHERIPTGVLHPRRTLRGVVGGVRDYGNRMGIPTVSGGLHFDDRYLANPLVFCGCVGLIPRDKIAKSPQAGDRVVVVGGRTGRDGIGGATFSSGELTDTHADEFAHAVQIGNPIEEKKVLDALMRARDHQDGCLYNSVTDCGAGGLSSAVGEMAAELGAVVHLERVPLKYQGLRYNEIWLSEAQERMVLAVPPERMNRLMEVFAAESVEATDIGEFTGDGLLSVKFQDEVVGQLDVEFLHNGLPRIERSAMWTAPQPRLQVRKRPAVAPADCSARLMAALGSLNVCSRESIFRQYDQEVQGGSSVKTLVGMGEGPSDAAVIRPRLESYRGVAIGQGFCPQLADDDPYWMAVLAVDEAVRNLVCVGADPERIAILDNFCWGGCDHELALGALVRTCQGCHDAALAYATPFISGKDSLNNQFSLSEQEATRLDLPATIAIPNTLLISAIGIVRDVRRCVTSDLKSPGARLVYVWRDPRRDGPQACAQMHRAVARFITEGSVTACHDIGDGGLAVCLAEMCIAGRRGAEVDLAMDEATLFEELRSAYVLELTQGAETAELARHAQVATIGQVTERPRLTIRLNGVLKVDQSIDDLESAWRSGLNLD